VGLTFCFIGKLNTLTRTEAENMVSVNGGEPKNSVVKGFSYMVTNSSDLLLQDALVKIDLK
jgi:NAD-dependent DNA ligase